MERAIVDIIENDTAVDAILNKRIFPNTIPQNELFPAIIYTRVITEPTDTKDGVSKLDSITIDLDFFGIDYKILKDLAGKVKTAIDRFSGTKQSQVIEIIIFADQRSTYDTEGEVYHITQTYKIRQKI